jgi:hypothetical protein
MPAGPAENHNHASRKLISLILCMRSGKVKSHAHGDGGWQGYHLLHENIAPKRSQCLSRLGRTGLDTLPVIDPALLPTY